MCVSVCSEFTLLYIPEKLEASPNCSEVVVSNWCSLIGVCSCFCSLLRPLPLLLVPESTGQIEDSAWFDVCEQVEDT